MIRDIQQYIYAKTSSLGNLILKETTQDYFRKNDNLSCYLSRFGCSLKYFSQNLIKLNQIDLTVILIHISISLNSFPVKIVFKPKTLMFSVYGFVKLSVILSVRLE